MNWHFKGCLVSLRDVQIYLAGRLVNITTAIDTRDMLQFLASEPENTIWKLNHAALWAGEQMAEKGAQAKATSEEIKKILQWFVQIEQFCDKLKLNHAKNRADLFKAFLENEMECYSIVSLSPLRFAR